MRDIWYGTGRNPRGRGNFLAIRLRGVPDSAAECHKANPDNHVRLIGYNSMKQTRGAAMAVYRGKGYQGPKGL